MSECVQYIDTQWNWGCPFVILRMGTEEEFEGGKVGWVGGIKGGVRKWLILFELKHTKIK